jgi:hypothetical protein
VLALGQKHVQLPLSSHNTGVCANTYIIACVNNSLLWKLTSVEASMMMEHYSLIHFCRIMHVTSQFVLLHLLQAVIDFRMVRKINIGEWVV